MLESTVYHRLGAWASVDGEALTVHLDPTPLLCHHGMVRIGVLAYLVDVVAVIPIDVDPDAWTFTSDLSVRARPVADPGRLQAHSRTLRRGARSVVCSVTITDGTGNEIAAATVGFSRVARRAGDPPKPEVSLALASRLVGGPERLTTPLRVAAGIVSIDPVGGVVEVAMTPEVRNAAGTLHGALVACVAEAAAEDLLAARADGPVVVVDLDVRYLAQTGSGPLRTSARLLGADAGAPVEVTVTDISTGRVTAHAFARGVGIGVGVGAGAGARRRDRGSAHDPARRRT